MASNEMARKMNDMPKQYRIPKKAEYHNIKAQGQPPPPLRAPLLVFQPRSALAFRVEWAGESEQVTRGERGGRVDLVSWSNLRHTPLRIGFDWWNLADLYPVPVMQRPMTGRT